MMSVLTTLLGIYLLMLGLMYFFQDKLLFMPTSEMVQTPESAGLVAEDLWVNTDDGIRIHGWYFPNKQASNVIVLSHGNAGNISYRLDIAETLLQTGASVYMYDYRGFGKSEGSPTEDGLYMDIMAVIDGLVDIKGYREDQIIMYGRSLGGAVASYAAANRNLGGLVIDSAFKNLRAMVRDVYPFVPSRLAAYEFPTEEYLMMMKDRVYPVMVMHSPGDEIVGVHHGEYLYSVLDEPKQFVELRGGHNDNFFRSKELIAESWQWYLEEISGIKSR
jgi:fermentation-respiration switch protein FrsA (DUF1100 family)